MGRIKDDTTARTRGKLTPIDQLPIVDKGHIFKFCKTLGVYYCRCCRGVRSPKLGKV